MITLCLLTSSTSCRKARDWLRDNQIPFRERNMRIDPLSVEELKQLLQLTYNGIGDLISTKSKVYEDLDLADRLDNISLSEAIDLLSQHPDLLRRPIIFDRRRLLCGFNQEEIRMFIPHERRIISYMEALEPRHA